MKKYYSIAAIGGALLLLTGCASGGPGLEPAAVAPRLVVTKKKIMIAAHGTCRESQSSQQISWDKPRAFGRVPAELQSAGNAVCQSSCGDLVAIGYHPAAVDLTGHAGAGFLCGFKKKVA